MYLHRGKSPSLILSRSRAYWMRSMAATSWISVVDSRPQYSLAYPTNSWWSLQKAAKQAHDLIHADTTMWPVKLPLATFEYDQVVSGLAATSVTVLLKLRLTLFPMMSHLETKNQDVCELYYWRPHVWYSLTRKVPLRQYITSLNDYWRPRKPSLRWSLGQASFRCISIPLPMKHLIGGHNPRMYHEHLESDFGATLGSSHLV